MTFELSSSFWLYGLFFFYISETRPDFYIKTGFWEGGSLILASFLGNRGSVFLPHLTVVMVLNYKGAQLHTVDGEMFKSFVNKYWNAKPLG